ncbi:hypothetical protein NDK47_16590 [Brevibacillus ruminantium]|uniref:Uncharacterized protein n=1 Tax=Brevibacillus ruminantium TaxID=2950604 RepID=A0ABY4W9E0_9BACL|nr:hypothetical protein [Brevibacillus ruminantium]USG63785.1 hypothetical protein NDK47_16590 [Brevibacillus ruminantium]
MIRDDDVYVHVTIFWRDALTNPNWSHSGRKNCCFHDADDDSYRDSGAFSLYGAGIGDSTCGISSDDACIVRTSVYSDAFVPCASDT